MNKWLLVTIFCCLSVPLFAQNTAMYASKWHIVDSLIEQSLPQSAHKTVQDIYNTARIENDHAQMTKAGIYMMYTGNAQEENEDAAVKNIAYAEKQAATTAAPWKNIWYSIAAEQYWNYYQSKRWQIMHRTSVSGEAGADIAQWDAAQFYRKTAALYQASLKDATLLKQADIGRFDVLLVKGTHTAKLRPTLYDLLVFRAIDFFRNDEKSLAQPAQNFTIKDPALFSPAENFTRLEIKTPDTASLYYQALKLYQDVLAFHLKDPEALIDADLQRLAFVYEHAVMPGKKQLYLQALKSLSEKYAGNAAVAEVAYRYIQLKYEATENTHTEDADKQPKTDLVAMRTALQKIITQYPGSEGAIHAAQAVQNIEHQELSIEAGNVVLPNEPSLVSVAYRNVPKAYFKLVKQNKEALLRGYDDYGWTKNLPSLPVVGTWSIDLPGTANFQPHRTEIKTDALPEGMYSLLVSADPGFKDTNNLLHFVHFQVSHISVVTTNGSQQNMPSGFVLDRKTGAAITNAQVVLYTNEWNRNSSNYTLKKTTTATSGSDGAFTISGGNSYNALEITSGASSLMLNDYLNLYRNEYNSRPEVKTFFFTDRAIYRPGQTIWFKGILVQADSNGRKNNVLSGRKTTVTLYDANGQKVKDIAVQTNEYGSFNGSFTAPEGSLAGQMRISATEGGDKYISVEEYKRPKFEVVFDTLRNSYALNETVQVKGMAKAYAGNNLDGATVKYRVTRQAHWPYEWMFYRRPGGYAAQQEIASGEVKTAADGSFRIAFTTIPDETVDEQTFPVFTYSISADVTDLNGETRSGNTALSAGYRSLQIVATIPEQAKPEQLDTLHILTRNLNDVFVAASVKMTISPLRQPQQVIRKRLWQKPDQFVTDEASFRRDFPQDEYREESNHLTWASEAPVYTTTFTTTATGAVHIPARTWQKNGWYLVTLETTDSKGRQITEKKYVQVWSAGNSGRITDPMLVTADNKNTQPSDKISVQLVSGYTDLNLVRTVESAAGTFLSTAPAANGKTTWNYTITEADRGGMVVQWLAVKENRVYHQAVPVPVNWSNKDLHISWETHRDKLQPGAKETWTMVISGQKKDKVAAEMVATLYDASLDALRHNSWDVYGLYPSYGQRISWNTNIGFNSKGSTELSFIAPKEIPNYEKEYDRLISWSNNNYAFGFIGGGRMVKSAAVRRGEEAPAAAPAGIIQMKAVGNLNIAGARAESDLYTIDGVQINGNRNENVPAPVTFRKNLSETAFFLPLLRTDASGNVRISFTMPEALTEWRLRAFAHTTDMRYGMLEGSVRTQKDLMVVPGLPRFLRQGDDMVITTKISNLSDHELRGSALLDIADPQTGQLLALPFRIDKAETSFTVAAGQSTLVSWRVHVPGSRYEPVALRISARAGDFTDGEENTLPVVSNRMLVTETLPLWINGSGTKEFTLPGLLNSGNSSSLSQYNLAVEYTTNPAWYAVQALPYLTEYPYECAEQTFNRYYANALAAGIVRKTPRLKAILDQWQQADTSALLSALQHNQELKTALLQETPWVMEAQNETEQRHRIVLLFNAARMNRELAAALKKLGDMQLDDGGFPWFKGMSPSRYISQYIAAGIGRLQQLGVSSDKSGTQQLLDKLLPYLDRQVKADYDLLIQQKDKGEGRHIDYEQVQYLYMRSFFPGRTASEGAAAVGYFTQQAKAYWPSFNPYMKGMTALALYRTGDRQTAATIIRSLRETAIRNEETGMYWEQPHSWWWYEAPVETQSLLIACFTEITGDTAAVNEMKLWLLKQKQTQNWATTKATADACYALLLSGSNWLSAAPQVTLQLGSKKISSTEQKQQAGTGYFKQSYRGNAIQPEMGHVSVTATGSSSASWGAVYWQYFQDMDQVAAAATGVAVTKQLYIERNSDRGPVLERVTEAHPLKVGDKVTVRLLITADRDMEYVQLKDTRSACMEPVHVLSGYRWQDGLGYYESTGDVSSSFFIGYLPKGKYVFEYPVYITHTGSYSNGIASLQCMYAPEFTAHSKGEKISVQ